MTCAYLTYLYTHKKERSEETALDFLKHVRMPLESHSFKLNALNKLEDGALIVAALIVEELSEQRLEVDTEFVYDLVRAVIKIGEN